MTSVLASRSNLETRIPSKWIIVIIFCYNGSSGADTTVILRSFLNCNMILDFYLPASNRRHRACWQIFYKKTRMSIQTMSVSRNAMQELTAEEKSIQVACINSEVFLKVCSHTTSESEILRKRRRSQWVCSSKSASVEDARCTVATRNWLKRFWLQCFIIQWTTLDPTVALVPVKSKGKKGREQLLEYYWRSALTMVTRKAERSELIRRYQ